VFAGPASAAHTTATGDGLEIAYVGRPAFFTIIATDALGNAREEGGDEVRYQKQELPK